MPREDSVSLGFGMDVALKRSVKATGRSVLYVLPTSRK